MEAAFLTRIIGGKPSAVYRFEALTREELGQILASLHQTHEHWEILLSVLWEEEVDMATRMRLVREVESAREATRPSWGHGGDPSQLREIRDAAESCETQIRHMRSKEKTRRTLAPKKASASRQELNVCARERCKADSKFAAKTARQWATELGCSVGTVSKLPMWKAVQERKNKGRAATSPKVVSLTKNLESNIDQSGRVGRHVSTASGDSILDDLIRDQHDDRELSPLAPDTESGRNTRTRRRA